MPGPYLSGGNYIMEMGSTDLLKWVCCHLSWMPHDQDNNRHCLLCSIRHGSLVWIPHCKSIPAWQKCLLPSRPASNPSSTRPDQLNLRLWVSFLNGRLQPRGLLPRALSGADTSVNAGRLLAGNEYLFPAEVWPITGSAPRAPYRPRCGCGSHIGSSVRRARSPARLGHRHTPSGGESE